MTCTYIQTLVDLGWYTTAQAYEIYRKHIKPCKGPHARDRALYNIISKRRKELQLP